MHKRGGITRAAQRIYQDMERLLDACSGPILLDGDAMIMASCMLEQAAAAKNTIDNTVAYAAEEKPYPAPTGFPIPPHGRQENSPSPSVRHAAV